MGIEYKKALVKIPTAFYERETTIYASALVTLLGMMIAQSVGGDLPNYILPITSSVTYLIGRVMDRGSTTKGLGVMQRADELGVTYPFRENNDLLPEKLSPEEHQQHPKKYVDFVGSALCPIFLPWGFAAGLSSGFVALNNSRKIKRLQLAIKTSMEGNIS